MSATALISGESRISGWNIHLLHGSGSDMFAGLFHLPGSNSLTYRDIVNELRLCFDIPIDSGAGFDHSTDTWMDIAFAYGGSVGGNLQPPYEDASTATNSSPRIISGHHLDEVVSTPQGNQSSGLARFPIVRLHVVRHGECGISRVEPLTAHLRAGCAKHIPYPSLRRDERYLSPNKAPENPLFSRLPYRKTIRPTRGSQSPAKRSASGSISPTKDTQSNIEVAAAEDITGMVAPPTFNIPPEQARQCMAAFRDSCLTFSTKCAVTGKGQSWYMNPSVGPGVQACHIVPQQHYHVYPLPTSFCDNRYSPRHLCEAWDCTWSAANGILLFSHLHDAYDRRLFSIHPETHRIRVFMPYDVLLDYHDTVAQLSPIVDSRALRHHYDMCCIENMSTKVPISDAVVFVEASGSEISGAASPLVSRRGTPILPSVTSRGNNPPHAPSGDPSKQVRKVHNEPAGDRMDFAPDIAPIMIDGSSASSSSLDEVNPPHKREDVWYVSEQTRADGFKKRRRDSESENTVLAYNEESQSDGPNRDPYWDGYVTPWNKRTFLADVNWELSKIQGWQ